MATKGKLLVAAPSLIDPNFHRTVVMVCEHDDDGAFGVVLNRPSEAEVVEYLPAWRDQLSEPGVVFVGGPVQPETAIGLAEPAAGRGPPDVWTRITGPIGLLDLSAGPDALAVDRLRVFSGYAGWSARQLDAEIASGDWFVVESGPGDCFSEEPDELWRAVLRRQSGSLAMVATFPPDPRLN